MRVDLRVKHDIEARKAAIGLFERGHGFESAAKALSVPRDTVRQWLYVYRSFGSEVLLSMDGKQARYTHGQRVAAASAVVDGGMSKQDAMKAFGIMSMAPLKRWCALYRGGGAEALRPKPKGRPRGSGSKPRERTREQELEERCRRLETEVAYLKKIARPGREGRALTRAKAEAVRALRSDGHDLGRLLACSGLARSTYYYALAHPAGPTRPELRAAVAEVFSRTANGCGHRQVAMCLRAELGARIADKTVLKMMREMGIRCGIRRETDYHRYNSYKGVVGETFENVIGRDFSADGPWLKMGTDVTEFKQPWGKAYFAPVYDFGSKEIVAWSTSTSPDMAQQAELLDQLLAKMPEGATPVLHSDMGWQYQHAAWCGRLKDAGIVQSMSRKGNCIDNGATEQVFGHMKDEFFRGRTWPDFESFKADLDAYVAHWNTRRRQVKLKGLTPEEFRSQPLAA